MCKALLSKLQSVCVCVAVLLSQGENLMGWGGQREAHVCVCVHIQMRGVLVPAVEGWKEVGGFLPHLVFI